MRLFTEAERVEVWERRQAGESNRSVGRRLGRSAGSIRAFVECFGGVRPEPRRRSPSCLSLTEREEISRGLAAGEHFWTTVPSPAHSQVAELRWPRSTIGEAPGTNRGPLPRRRHGFGHPLATKRHHPPALRNAGENGCHFGAPGHGTHVPTELWFVGAVHGDFSSGLGTTAPNAKSDQVLCVRASNCGLPVPTP